MITGFLKLLAGLWSWLGSVMAAIGLWFREDHDWWRLLCLGLAFAFTAASFVAWDARQTIVFVKAECAANILATTAECAAVKSQAHSLVMQTNAEAARQIAQARRDERDERDAKVAAVAESARLKGEASKFDQRMREARKHPDCDALLNTDVSKVCGL